MIEWLAAKIAAGIKRSIPDHPASFAVLKFSLSIVLNIFFIISLSLLISVWTGRTSEVGMILFSFALLRQVSGGLHLKTGMACVVVTTLLFTALSFVNVGTVYVQIMNGISLLLVLLFAPSGIEKQSRIPKRHYPKLKAIAAVLVLLNVLIQSPIIAASFFVQCLTLISRREVNNL